MLVADVTLETPSGDVEVGVFLPEESAAYLATVLVENPRLLEGAVDLAQAVGHLPLALSQAAAYLADRELTCSEYVLRFADRQRMLAELLPEPDALPDEHQTTVAATWSLSIEHADRLTPAGLARPLLRLCAILDPNGIPMDVLTAAPALEHLGEVTAEKARDGLACLHRLNLITFDPANTHAEVRVHALVQRATRDHHPAGDQPLAQLVADALLAAWPDIERDTALAAALRINTAALSEHSGDDLWKPGVHRVLFRAGSSMGDPGQAASARDYFAELHTTATRLGSAAFPDALAARANLALWQGEAGDTDGAAAAFAELIDDMLRVLEAHRPSVYSTRSHLASWRGHAGDPARAVAAFAELLEDMLRVLDADHPNIFTTRHNLAYWRGEAGDAAGAADAYAELLDDMLRVVAADHPSTFSTRHNLACRRGEAGDAARAAVALAELLDDRLRVLGPDHLDTLNTRANLARWLREAGDAAGATDALAELLADQLRVLGPDHSDTIATRFELAEWRGKT